MNRARNAPQHQHGRQVRWGAGSTAVILIALAVLAAAVPAARGQEASEAVVLEDLGFTTRLHAGARAAGMAGAYTALGGDLHSLVYNPAGLAPVRRIEFAFGLQHQRGSYEGAFFGNPGDVTGSTSSLDFIGAAYPLPVYRGSFVVAAGVYQLASSELSIINRGRNAVTLTDDDYRLQQSGSTFSYNVGFGTEISRWVSFGLSAFVLDGTVSASTQYSSVETTPPSPGDLVSVSLVDDAKLDVSGVGGTMGLALNAHRSVRLGLSIGLPTYVSLSGSGTQELTKYFENSPDSFEVVTGKITTDYLLPLRYDAGAVFTFRHLSVSADAMYQDWRGVRMEDRAIKDDQLQPIFREVFQIRTGAELIVPRTMARLRAGYAYLPYPLAHLQDDRISGDGLEAATITHQRQLFSAGFGWLFREDFMLDAALEYSTGERTTSAVTDTRSTTRILLAGSYRF